MPASINLIVCVLLLGGTLSLASNTLALPEAAESFTGNTAAAQGEDPSALSQQLRAQPLRERCEVAADENEVPAADMTDYIDICMRDQQDQQP